jgi:hypothetical protein
VGKAVADAVRRLKTSTHSRRETAHCDCQVDLQHEAQAGKLEVMGLSKSQFQEMNECGIDCLMRADREHQQIGAVDDLAYSLVREQAARGHDAGVGA